LLESKIVGMATVLPCIPKSYVYGRHVTVTTFPKKSSDNGSKIWWKA